MSTDAFDEPGAADPALPPAVLARMLDGCPETADALAALVCFATVPEIGTLIEAMEPEEAAHALAVGLLSLEEDAADRLLRVAAHRLPVLVARACGRLSAMAHSPIWQVGMEHLAALAEAGRMLPELPGRPYPLSEVAADVMRTCHAIADDPRMALAYLGWLRRGASVAFGRATAMQEHADVLAGMVADAATLVQPSCPWPRQGGGAR